MVMSWVGEFNYYILEWKSQLTQLSYQYVFVESLFWRQSFYSIFRTIEWLCPR